MKISKTFPRLGLSLVLSLTFFLLPINKVYADTGSDERTFWHWFAVENIPKYNGEHGGGGFADVSEASAEEMGISTEEFIYNHTGMSGDEFVNSVYNPIGYGVQHDYSSFFNVPVTPEAKATYSVQKTLRTDSEGNVNVSGSDFWHSVYNKWFSNKNSYKTQYEQTPDGGYTVKFNDISVIVVNINYGDRSANWVKDGNTNPVVRACMNSPTSYSLTYHQTTNIDDIVPLISITLQTNQGTATIYYPETWLHTECVQFYNHGGMVIRDIQWSAAYNQLHVFFGSADGYTISYSDYFTFKSGFVYESTQQNTGSTVAQPSQVGFIKWGNDKVPVYRNKDDNDFTINPNGTATVNENGTDVDYPIYVDPSQLTGDGWQDVLDFADDSDQNSSDYDDNGFPWNTQNDGTALGGFFSNMIRDISNMFKGIADNIKKIFQKPIDILSDLVEKIKEALSDFFDIDYGSLNDVELDVNYNIIATIWEKFLEILGVSS